MDIHTVFVRVSKKDSMEIQRIPDCEDIVSLVIGDGLDGMRITFDKEKLKELKMIIQEWEDEENA